MAKFVGISCSTILSGRRLSYIIKQSRGLGLLNPPDLRPLHCCFARTLPQKAIHTIAKDMTVAHCNSRISSCIPGIRSETRSLKPNDLFRADGRSSVFQLILCINRIIIGFWILNQFDHEMKLYSPFTSRLNNVTEHWMNVIMGT